MAVSGCKHPLKCFIRDGYMLPLSKQNLAATVKCLACWTDLPLGPARITPEVALEIRAAELALIGSWWNIPHWESEFFGALQFHNGGSPGYDDDGGDATNVEAETVGWLACVIAQHQDES